jgi:nitrite reductase/ring-hydroxylating ferredoxin subunit
VVRFLVGKRSDIQEGEFTNVTVGGRQILVGKIQGSYFATGNMCTHEGAESHEGEVLGPIESYTVIIEDDKLFVEI